jgi:hypothetical protein
MSRLTELYSSYEFTRFCEYRIDQPARPCALTAQTVPVFEVLTDGVLSAFEQRKLEVSDARDDVDCGSDVCHGGVAGAGGSGV